MRPDLITPDMELGDILAWEFLHRIVVNNWGKVVAKTIRVPLGGCTIHHPKSPFSVYIVERSP